MQNLAVLDAQPVARPTYVVETITHIDDCAGIEAEWRALDRQSGAATFFQSYDWCVFVWRTLLANKQAGDISPRVIVVRDGPRIIAVWPVLIRPTFGMRIVEDLTEPFGQYADVLVAPQADVDAVMAHAKSEISTWGVDAVILRKVRETATVGPWLKENARTVGELRHAPAANLTAFADFESYKASLNSKTRKNLRNYRNRLKRLGTLVHEEVVDPALRRDLTLRCLNWRSDWLAQSGLSSTAFQHPVFPTLIHGLASGGDDVPMLKVMRLTLAREDGETIELAIQWGFPHAGRYYAFMSAKHPDYDAFSPGRLHLEDVVRTCAEDGLGVVDFMVPDMPYKATWATESVGVAGFGLAMTLKGRGIIDGWHGAARPALKAAFLSLPVSVRRAAADWELCYNTRNRA